MKKILMLVLLAAAINLSAQSVISFGGGPAATYATSLSQCPVATGQDYKFCIIVNGTTQPQVALSVAAWQNGAPFVIGGGTAPTFTVAQTTTLPAGSQATVSLNSNNQFSFGIPQGAVGAQGAAGPAGTTDYQQLINLPTTISCPIFDSSTVNGASGSNCKIK